MFKHLVHNNFFKFMIVNVCVYVSIKFTKKTIINIVFLPSIMSINIYRNINILSLI